MSFIIKRPVFAHSFLNTLSNQSSNDIEFSIANSSGNFAIEKEAIGPQTYLMLTIKHPKAIGLTDHRNISDESIRDLVLALNLSLKDNCVNIIQEGLHGSEVIRPPNLNVTVTQEPNRLQINMACEISTSVHFTLGSKEEIDEQTALSTYMQIRKFNRYNFKAISLKEVNVSKALNEYENAMQPIDKIKVFRSLYNCLEFCVNSTGTKKEKDTLDAEISAISETTKETAKLWREFYNRIKHADTKDNQTNIYRQGIAKMTTVLPEIRLASKKLLFHCF